MKKQKDGHPESGQIPVSNECVAQWCLIRRLIKLIANFLSLSQSIQFNTIFSWVYITAPRNSIDRNSCSLEPYSFCCRGRETRNFSLSRPRMRGIPTYFVFCASFIKKKNDTYINGPVFWCFAWAILASQIRPCPESVKPSHSI